MCLIQKKRFKILKTFQLFRVFSDKENFLFEN